MMHLLNPANLKIVIGDKINAPTEPRSNTEHLQATIDWLCHAHDATGKKGVSLGYSMRQGWLPAYPETSGYIICTLLDYYNFCKHDDYRQRAYMLADWEIDVQMKCGAVQSGSVADNPVPCVFNTGQVILGWLQAYKASENNRYLEAARRACDWLLSIQDEDGSWRQHVYGKTPHVYNTRTAWGLGRLYLLTKDKTYFNGARQNLNWALKQQQANGWFANNSFLAKEHPLIHNIAYAIRGILELGLCFDESEYIESAQKAADVLLRLQENDGRLGNRYDSEWRSIDKSSCLVGYAQMAIIWFKLYRLTKDKSYCEAGGKANYFLKSTHNLTSTNPGIRGGLKGSQPVYGLYQAYRYPNWAAKFFADALLIEELIKRQSTS